MKIKTLLSNHFLDYRQIVVILCFPQSKVVHLTDYIRFLRYTHLCYIESMSYLYLNFDDVR